MIKALLLAGADPTLYGWLELPEGTGKGKLAWSKEYLLKRELEAANFVLQY